MDITTILVALVAAVVAGALANAAVMHAFPELTRRERGRRDAAASRRRRREQATRLAGRLAGLLPAKAEDAAVDRDRLAQAGLRIPEETWRGVQLASAVGLGALGSALFVLSPATDLPQKVLLAVASFAAGWFLPQAFLWARANDRREAIEREVPAALDLLCLAVRAGYSLERGIKLVGREGKGEIAREFRQVDADVNLLGMDLSRALRRMSARCGAPSVTAFCAAITQAQAQGTSVTRVLTSQARMARDAQYTATMKKVNSRANKMTPVVILVFIPMICAIVLVPTIVNLVSQFTGMGGLGA